MLYEKIYDTIPDREGYYDSSIGFKYYRAGEWFHSKESVYTSITEPEYWFKGCQKNDTPFLLDVHGMNCSGPMKSVCVFAESEKEAFDKVKRKYGDNYIGTYRIMNDVLY